MPEYQSSEAIQQKHSADVFARKEKEKAALTTEKDKVIKVLDKYIEKYGTTRNLLAQCKENKISADQQLLINDGIIVILEKIKSELG